MIIALKPKAHCPTCQEKVQPVKITNFLKVCPKCHDRIN